MFYLKLGSRRVAEVFSLSARAAVSRGWFWRAWSWIIDSRWAHRAGGNVQTPDARASRSLVPVLSASTMEGTEHLILSNGNSIGAPFRGLHGELLPSCVRGHVFAYVHVCVVLCTCVCVCVCLCVYGCWNTCTLTAVSLLLPSLR